MNGDSRPDASKLTVSTLGPAGTYSHQATKQLFATDEPLNLLQTIRAVFEAVDQGSSSSRGVCPIENSTNGPVAETQSCLKEYDVEEIDRTTLNIGHALLRKKVDITIPVQKVYSHEQALGQCKRYLAKRYPNVSVLPTDSTALAAQLASEDPESVAVASLMCADVYNLELLDTEIQDGEANRTTFIAFRKRCQ